MSIDKFTGIAGKILVVGVAADGSKHALSVLQAVDQRHDFGYEVLVQLPDVKADPQQVVTLKLQLEGQNRMITALSDQVKSWEKRFDALLAVKGGAA